MVIWLLDCDCNMVPSFPQSLQSGKEPIGIIIIIIVVVVVVVILVETGLLQIASSCFVLFLPSFFHSQFHATAQASHL